MSDKQMWALGIIVLVYLWWHAKGNTAYARQYNGVGAAKGTSSSNSGGRTITTPNAVYSSASTAPRTRRQLPASSSPWAGGGSNLIGAPVYRGPGQSSSQRFIGAQSLAGTVRSAAAAGVGTGPISPTYPSYQVTSTRNIRLNRGGVQIPSWSAIPQTVRGPGGQGSIVNLG